MEIEEFAQEFFQDLVTESDADCQFVEDVFFQKACELLMETGELDTADRVAYRTPVKGIRVDGYGGEPDLTSQTLNLIVLDFHPTQEIGRLTGTEMNKAFQRVFNFLRYSLNKKWRNALEETTPAFGLADLIAKRWMSIARIRFLLISNRLLSERVDSRAADDFQDRKVTYSVWDIRRLHALATVGREREDIEIDLERDFGGALPILPGQQSESNHQSYLTIFPGEVLAEIYDRWGARLLEQNVRVFLQARGKVNRGIKNTIENEPSMFFAYNNGITATAEHVEIIRDGLQLMLHRLRNFQIVNGGQTTASIHVAKLRKIDLSKTFVQMKLSVVTPEKATELVPRISEYANSQNRVNASDFFANHPFHIRMENFSRRILAPSPDGTFRQSKWFYERARGQYADARSNLTLSRRKKFDLEYPRKQLFNKTDLAKFLNVWEKRPHEVSQGAQKNFAIFAQRIGQAWKKTPDDFNETFFQVAIAKAIIFKATERIVSEQPWYQGGYRANIVAYAIAKLALDVAEFKMAVDFESVWRRQGLGNLLHDAIVISADAVHEVIIQPPVGIRNVTEWAKKEGCWERVRKININWPNAFIQELISKQELDEAKKLGRRNQRELNGIEAQVAVVNAGVEFWISALEWGRKRRLLTEQEKSILSVAADIPRQTPSDKQSERVIQILSKLNSNGYEPTVSE